MGVKIIGVDIRVTGVLASSESIRTVFSRVPVTLDDMADANRIFSVLMGSKVEPRREYIEKHALEVRYLDV